MTDRGLDTLLASKSFNLIMLCPSPPPPSWACPKWGGGGGAARAGGGKLNGGLCSVSQDLVD